MNNRLLGEIKVAIIDMVHLTVPQTSSLRQVKLYDFRIFKYRISMITIRTTAVPLIDLE